MKATSKAVKASRAKAGKRSTSFFLTDSERAEIAAAAAEAGVSQTEIVLTGVRALALDTLSDARLLALLRARLARG